MSFEINILKISAQIHWESYLLLENQLKNQWNKIDPFAYSIFVLLQKYILIDLSKAYKTISHPPKKDMGDYSFPCFDLAKTQKCSPHSIASHLAKSLNPPPHFQKIAAYGPYLNFYLHKPQFINQVIQSILTHSPSHFNFGRKKTVVLDFSSPNIAKPFSIAHLRSTSIGNCLAKLYRFLGYQTIRINHLGDWGTSFGQLICAYQLWGKNLNIQSSPCQKLFQLYVRFHKNASSQQKIQAKSLFKQLELGDPEPKKLWSLFTNLSLKEFKRIYSVLNIDFDFFSPESSYVPQVPSLLQSLKEKKISSFSHKALVIHFPDMPPMLLQKQDGSSLYSTRDLCAALYRYQMFQFDQMLYVVGSEQKLHFKQLFQTLNMMGCSWSKSCQHINFGLIQFEKSKMSTREGKIIFLEDVIQKAKELILQKINQSPLSFHLSESEKNRRALQLGLSSIVFFDLKHKREKDIAFDWEDILNPKGETGVYVQYAYSRLCGIIRKFHKVITCDIKDIHPKSSSGIVIDDESIFDICKKLYDFKNQLLASANYRQPFFIARYLLDLSQAFSTYYKDHQVVDPQNISLSCQRILMVLAVQKIISHGLHILGIQPMPYI